MRGQERPGHKEPEHPSLDTLGRFNMGSDRVTWSPNPREATHLWHKRKARSRPSTTETTSQRPHSQVSHACGSRAGTFPLLTMVAVSERTNTVWTALRGPHWRSLMPLQPQASGKEHGG